MKQWIREFDIQDRDTCMVKWTFHLQKTDEAIVVQSVDILRDGRGCQGHPKTIAALIKNIAIDDIDVDALAESSCSRDQSCGQILAECLDLIRSEG